MWCGVVLWCVSCGVVWCGVVCEIKSQQREGRGGACEIQRIVTFFIASPCLYHRQVPVLEEGRERKGGEEGRREGKGGGKGGMFEIQRIDPTDRSNGPVCQ
jgi:hypothetical protein